MDKLKSNKVDNENNEIICENSSSEMDYLGNVNLGCRGNRNINNNVGLIHSVSVPEYSGGSLVKWRVSALRQERDKKRDSAFFRHSLHWEEFFGKFILNSYFRMACSFLYLK